MNQLIVFGAKYLIFFLLLLAFLFFLKQKPNQRKQLVILGLISLPLIYLAAKLSALFYFDPRPFVSGHFIPLIKHSADNGFPSDHVLLSSAVAMVIFYYNRWQGLVLLILAVLVGLARILAGVHSPVDIIGSIVISFIVSSLVYYSIKSYLDNKFPSQSKGTEIKQID